MTVQLVPWWTTGRADPINRLPWRRFLLVCVRRSSGAEREDTEEVLESWQEQENIAASTPCTRASFFQINKHIFIINWCINSAWAKLKYIFFWSAFLRFVQESLPACSCELCLWSCCSLQSLIHKHGHLGVCLLQPKSCLLTTEQMHHSGG